MTWREWVVAKASWCGLALVAALLCMAHPLAPHAQSAPVDLPEHESTPSEAELQQALEGARIQQSLFGRADALDPESFALSMDEPALLFINPLTASFSSNGEELAQRRVRVRDQAASLEFRCQQSEVVWSELQLPLSRLAFSAMVSRAPQIGSERGTLRIRITFRNTTHFLVLKPSRPSTLLLTKLRGKREIPVASAEQPQDLTGDPKLSFHVEGGVLSAWFGAQDDDPPIQTNLTGSRDEDVESMHEYFVSLGAQDGSLKLKDLSMDAALPPQWWRQSFAENLDRAAMYELRALGITGALRTLTYALPAEVIEAEIEKLSPSEAELWQQGKYAELFKQRPDSLLALFHHALRLKRSGKIASALKLLQDRDNALQHAELNLLQAELALRSEAPSQVSELLGIVGSQQEMGDPRAALLAGLAAAKLGKMEAALQHFESMRSAHGDQLAAGCARLIALRKEAPHAPLFHWEDDARSLTLTQLSADENPLHVSALADWFALLVRTIGLPPSGAHNIEVWIGEDARSFVELALPFAHDQVDRLGALTLLPSEQDQPVLVLLCDAAGNAALRASALHELTHALLHAHQTDGHDPMPLWLHEGYAVMMSSVESVQDGTPHFALPQESEGLIPAMIAALEHEDAAKSLRTLLLAEHESFYARGGSEANYAMAWALVWYLTNTPADPLALKAAKIEGESADKREGAQHAPMARVRKVAAALADDQTLRSDEALSALCGRMAAALHAAYGAQSAGTDAQDVEQDSGEE